MGVRHVSITGTATLTTGLLTVLAAAMAVVTFAVPASAQPPLRLDPGPITDQVGVLGDTDDALAAVADLAERTGVGLVAVFVESFDGMSTQAWADETATISGLGTNDVLLAVAVGDRIYAPLNVDAGFQLSDATLADIATRHIEPRLAEDDWAGAVEAAATALSDELSGSSSSSSGSGDSSDSGGGGLLWIVLLLLVGGIGVLVWRSRRSRSPQAVTDPDDLTSLGIDELRQRTGALLVRVDDDVRTSEQEASFAEAEFGPDAAGDLRRSIAAAREALAAGFAENQRLADVPDGPDTRAAYAQVIDRCEAAAAAIEDHLDAFQQLRDQRERIPESVRAIEQRIDRAQQRLPELTGIIDELTAAYAPAAVTRIQPNVGDAATRLEFAAAALAEVADAQAGGDDNAAVLSLRDAESAVAQGEQLIDAVHAAGDELRSASAALDGALAQLRSDVEAVDQRVRAGADELTAPLAAARTALQETQTAQAAGDLDPVAAMGRLAQVSVPLEQALHLDQQLRDRFDELEHAAAARIAGVEGFVTTRRGAVGADARTRLAQAVRTLDDARSRRDTDLAAAVDGAQRALTLAQEASQQAERDVAAYRMPPPPPTPGPRRSVGTGAVAGAAIGGIAMGSRRTRTSAPSAPRTTPRTTTRSTPRTTTRSTGGSSGRRGSSGGSSGRRGGGGGRF